MRTAMLGLLALALVAPSVGCSTARDACGGGCQSCDHGSGCVRRGAYAHYFGPSTRVTPSQEGAGAPGETAHVGYPYYTTRGPRDFLLNNPPPLGY